MNHIRETSVELLRLSSADAEVWVHAVVDQVTPTTELRGRLMGPRCAGVTTIEVAYPIRPQPRPPEDSSLTLAARVVIPEPNLWTQETPFFYEGPCELWQDGQRCDETTVSVALKKPG